MTTPDIERWNRKHKARGLQRVPPAPTLIAWRDALGEGGRILDAAGGRGRHARYLASEGFDVTLCDASPVAIDLGQAMAREDGPPIEGLVHDLEAEGWPSGRYDGIVVVHFLHRPLFESVTRHVEPGGWFLFIHPTKRNLERHSKPSARWLLEEGEGHALLATSGLTLLREDESWGASGRHEYRALARRDAPTSEP